MSDPREMMQRYLRGEYEKNKGHQPTGKDARAIDKLAGQAAAEAAKNRSRKWEGGNVLSRLPLIAALVTFAFFAAWAVGAPPHSAFAGSFPGASVDASLAVTADEQGYEGTGGQVLLGFSVRESAASAAVATIILRKGTSDAGTAIAAIELNPNESAREWWGGVPGGIATPAGVYIDHVAGTADVILFYAN